MKGLLCAGLILALILTACAETAGLGIGAWHGGRATMLRRYGYVGAMVQGRFFPAVPPGPRGFHVIPREGKP